MPINPLTTNRPSGAIMMGTTRPGTRLNNGIGIGASTPQTQPAGQATPAAPTPLAGNVKFQGRNGAGTSGAGTGTPGASQTGSTGSQNGNIYDWSQPQAVASGTSLPGNVNPVMVASQRTPFEFPTPENSYTQNQILRNFYQFDPSTGQSMIPNYAEGGENGVGRVNGPGINAPDAANQGYQMNEFANTALGRKLGMTLGDFGIPDAVQSQMKVQAAQQVNAARDAQKQAARRQLASMGLLNDTASTNLDAQLDQQANQNIYNQYSNIDTQNAIERNKQFQQNLNDVLGAGMKAGDQAEQVRSTNINALMDAIRQNEQGRQFNITSNLDQDRLQAATGQWLENTQENRANILNSIANFLENYQLERQKQSAGFINDAAKTAVSDQANLASILRQGPIPAFGTGG